MIGARHEYTSRWPQRFLLDAVANGSPLSTETTGTASDQSYNNTHAAEPQIKML